MRRCVPWASSAAWSVVQLVEPHGVGVCVVGVEDVAAACPSSRLGVVDRRVERGDELVALAGLGRAMRASTATWLPMFDSWRGEP